MHVSETDNFGHGQEQDTSNEPRRERIRELNDQFRRTGLGGRQFITRGIQELGLLEVLAIRQHVASYDAFCNDNDPYGEHDFGNLTCRNKTVFWKIDYYDATLTACSPDPADFAVTTRVLTIMLAQEY